MVELESLVVDEQLFVKLELLALVVVVHEEQGVVVVEELEPFDEYEAVVVEVVVVVELLL